MILRETAYFEAPGEKNSEDALKAALMFLNEGKKHFVVATTRGVSGVRFAEALNGKDANLVCVTHSAGFRQPNQNELLPENRARIEAAGGKIYTGTILTYSIERALMEKHHGIGPTYLVAETLRMFCQGMKVCVEIVMEAVDAGLIPEGEEVVAAAGTAFGTDTVCLIQSAASRRFFDLRVLEIACKPRSAT